MDQQDLIIILFQPFHSGKGKSKNRSGARFRSRDAKLCLGNLFVAARRGSEERRKHDNQQNETLAHYGQPPHEKWSAKDNP